MFPFHSINTFSHLCLILCQFFFNTTSSSLSSLLFPINQSLFPSSANSSSLFLTSVTHSSTSFIPLYSSILLLFFPHLSFNVSISPSIKLESLSNYFPSFVTPSTSLHPSQPPCIISVSSVLRSNPFSSLHLCNHLSCHPSIMTLCSPGDQRLWYAATTCCGCVCVCVCAYVCGPGSVWSTEGIRGLYLQRESKRERDDCRVRCKTGRQGDTATCPAMCVCRERVSIKHNRRKHEFCSWFGVDGKSTVTGLSNVLTS